MEFLVNKSAILTGKQFSSLLTVLSGKNTLKLKKKSNKGLNTNTVPAPISGAPTIQKIFFEK